MGACLRLTLLAGVSGVLLLLLGYAALSALKGLMEVPPQSWGMSELSDAVVAGTCAIGALGALWHLVSAVVALIAIPGPHDRTSFRPGGAPGPAARFLNGWGAPAARRPRRWPSRAPQAATTWGGDPPARRPPHHPSPRRRHRRTSSRRRAPPHRQLRPLPPARTARSPALGARRRPHRLHRPVPVARRTRRRPALPGTARPRPRARRPRRVALISSFPERACGRSPPISCPPGPVMRRSRRAGPPCIAPTPMPSDRIRH